MTDATIATAAPCIFAGHSLFGPSIATQAGSTLVASDAFGGITAAMTVGAGATVGLGHVLFDVSAGASGLYTVALQPSPDTSLSLGVQDIPITSLEVGTITVLASPTTVPEPATWVQLSLGLAGLAAWIRPGRARR